MKTSRLTGAVLAILPALLSLWALPAQAQIVGDPWTYHVIDSGQGADGARLADVNGDGLLDIATAWEQDRVTRAYINPGFAGAASLWPKVTVGTTISCEDALFAKVDGDAAWDVISIGDGSKKIYLNFAPSDPAQYMDSAAWTQILLNTIPTAPVGLRNMFSVTGDLNNDNRTDIIVGSKYAGGQVGYYTANGDARNLNSWSYNKISDIRWTMTLNNNYDFDGDGDKDLLLSDRGDPANPPYTMDGRGVYWMENPGAAVLAANPGAAWTQHTVGAVGLAATFVDIGDINNDGYLDVAVPTFSKSMYLYFGQDDTGTAFEEVLLNISDDLAAFGTGKAFSIADVNGDGKWDLVLTGQEAEGDLSGVVWLSYGSDPTNPDDWTVHQVAGIPGQKFDLAAIADLNGDGLVDIITTEENNNSQGGVGGLGLIWYENPGGWNVPEPSSLALVGVGLLAAMSRGARGRRRQD